MTLNELYDIAEKDDIIIINDKLTQCPSLSIMDGNDCTIVIDYSKINSNSLHKVYIAHELGHCETGAFYNAYNYLDLCCRCEYKADKWAIKKLLPQEDVITALEKGYTEVWQLAEYFDVTEDLVKKAIWIYFDKQV